MNVWKAIKENTKDLLASKKASSATLLARADKIQGDQLPAVEERLEQLKGRKQEILLHGGEKDLVAIRGEIVEAEDEVEVLKLAVAALRKKAAEAAHEEHQAGHESARAASDEGVALVRTYLELAAQISGVLAQIKVKEAAIRASWEASRNSGSRRHNRLYAALRRARSTRRSPG